MNEIHNLSTYFFIQKKYFHALFYFESLLTYSICTRKEQCHSCFAANDNAFGNNLIATIFNSAVDFRVMIFITNHCRSFKKSSQVCKKNKKPLFWKIYTNLQLYYELGSKRNVKQIWQFYKIELSVGIRFSW